MEDDWRLFYSEYMCKLFLFRVFLLKNEASGRKVPGCGVKTFLFLLFELLAIYLFSEVYEQKQTDQQMDTVR